LFVLTEKDTISNGSNDNGGSRVAAA
jgi:hypothetical protein